MNLSETLTAALRAPSPETLWRLRGDLREVGVPADGKSLDVVREFSRFLDALATGSSSRAFSDMASKMDIAALGGVVLEETLEAEDGAELARRLLAGVLTEGLAVWATRQHVKAWEGELAAVYREAAWWLYDELWSWTATRRPGLAPDERRRLLETLLAPVLAAETPGPVKVVVIGRLFQVLLLDAVRSALAAAQP